jgi:hypothetical protein
MLERFYGVCEFSWQKQTTWLGVLVCPVEDPELAEWEPVEAAASAVN